MAVFTGLFGGQWHEGSTCGFNQKCKDAKQCISNTCAPLLATYGESVYQACITQCQTPPYPQKAEDVLCLEPVGAFESWGLICPNYDPSKSRSEQEKILGLSPFAWGAIIVLLLIIYFVWNR